MKMYEHQLTIGLFDKNEEVQLISSTQAKEFISEKLIAEFGIYAFTMIDCEGVYRMESSGNIVSEPSIRIEIASEEMLNRETVLKIVSELKHGLNQESIMYKVTESEIDFI